MSYRAKHILIVIGLVLLTGLFLCVGFFFTIGIIFISYYSAVLDVVGIVLGIIAILFLYDLLRLINEEFKKIKADKEAEEEEDQIAYKTKHILITIGLFLLMGLFNVTLKTMEVYLGLIPLILYNSLFLIPIFREFKKIKTK